MKFITSFALRVHFLSIWGLKIWRGCIEMLFKSLVLMITHNSPHHRPCSCRAHILPKYGSSTRNGILAWFPPQQLLCWYPVLSTWIAGEWLVKSLVLMTKEKVIEIDLHCRISIIRDQFSDKISDAHHPSIHNHFAPYLLMLGRNITKFGSGAGTFYLFHFLVFILCYMEWKKKV